MLDFIPQFLFLSLCWTSCYAISGRIAGGNTADPGEFPSTVALISFERFMCTGNIITTAYILSAGHCFTPVQCNQIIAGDNQLNGSSQYRQERNIKRIIIHPAYLKSRREITFDLALALLQSPLILNECVQIIPLAEQAPAINTICTNAGWGLTTLDTSGTASPSKVLRYHVVRVVEHYNCPPKFYNPDIVCTFSENTTAYKGDSGGPLICNKKLSGVLSSYYSDWGKSINQFANAPLASIWIHSNGTKGGCNRLGAYISLKSIWSFSSILFVLYTNLLL